jgi:hypothetical protein
MVWRARHPDNPWDDEADGRGEHRIQIDDETAESDRTSEKRSISFGKTNDPKSIAQRMERHFGYYGWEAHANLGLRTRGLEGSRRPYIIA